MEFRNLTPFDALAFSALDTRDRAYHVVVLKVGYRLVQDGGQWSAVLMDEDPCRLCLADEHWGAPGYSSIKQESDLAPYKPKCDVLVRGQSFAPQGKPASHWTARLRVVETFKEHVPAPSKPVALNPLMGLTLGQKQQWEHAQRDYVRRFEAVRARGSRVVLDKTIALRGPSEFFRTPLLGWKRSSSAAVLSVPLRWEQSFGGASMVPAAAKSPASAGEVSQPLLNEVCFSNPVGCGWMEARWEAAVKQSTGRLPSSLPAPQIEASDLPPLEAPVWASNPEGEVSAERMKEVVAGYKAKPVGLAALGRAWAPRLALAGTYDQAWLDTRHPKLPRDFDFAYYNAAPADQQIDFPDLLRGYVLQTENLTPGGGWATVALPKHRAYALMRMDDGLVLPCPMQVDHIELDNENQEDVRLLISFRCAVLKQAGVRVLEARFEVDPTRDLLTLEPSADYQGPTPEGLKAERARDAGEAAHG